MPGDTLPNQIANGQPHDAAKILGNENFLLNNIKFSTLVTKINTDSPYTVLSTDDIILCNATSGAITVNLPTAVEITGKRYIIKKTDSSTNAITIDGNGTETIEGALTFLLKSQYAFVEIVSNNSNWIVTNRWFAPARGSADRRTVYNFGGANTWYNLPLNGGNDNLKNISHSTVTNPERLTVTYAGVYRIRYMFIFHQINAVGCHDVGRLMINDTTEIPESYGQSIVNTSGQTTGQITGKGVASLNAGDYITLNVGTNDSVNSEVNYYDDVNLPNPTTFVDAVVEIEKIDE